jgi:hypothetical protein
MMERSGASRTAAGRLQNRGDGLSGRAFTFSARFIQYFDNKYAQNQLSRPEWTFQPDANWRYRPPADARPKPALLINPSNQGLFEVTKTGMRRSVFF